MLKPFYNKKRNIDKRLLPSATAADAGKVVGVTEEGGIALVEGVGDGRFLPVFTITNEEFTEVATDFVLFLNSITGLTEKRLIFTGATIKEKIKAIIDSGTFLCKLKVLAIPDFVAFGWVGSPTELYFPSLSYAVGATGTNYHCIMSFGYNDSITFVDVVAEPYPLANS